MPRITTEYYKDWPRMAPLGKKEDALLRQNLSSGEKVLGVVIGSFRQAIVSTTKKVLVIKVGFMAGQTFGAKVTSFDYSNLVGVEVRQGLVQGEFELLAGGLQTSQLSTINAKVNIAQLPNCVVFARQDAEAFNAMATAIRSMSQVARTQLTVSKEETHTVENATITAIKQLAELRDAGILTEEEFAAKKSDLLSKL